MSQITSKMNQSINPCTDFYEFACGSYIRDTSIPIGYNKWDYLMQNSQSISLTIKNILENPQTKYEGMAERQAKIYYDSCLDATNIREKLQGRPLIDLLDLFGGWDVLNRDNKPSPFIDESSNLKKIRYPDEAFTEEWNFGFFRINLEIDPKNSTKYLLGIYISILTLPHKDTYINSEPENLKFYNAYLESMIDIGNLLVSNTSYRHFKIQDDTEGRFKQSDINTTRDSSSKEDRQKKRESQLNIVMADVLEFERLIANFTPTLTDLHTLNESQYVVMSLKELDKKFDFMNWTRFAKQMFEPLNMSVSPDYVFRVYSFSYMENLNSLIKRYLNGTKSRRILHDYIMWHNVGPYVTYLSKVYRDAFKPVQKLRNMEDYEDLPSWKRCLQEFPFFMQFPLSSLYLRSNFNPRDKSKVEEMIDMIIVAYKESLKIIDWMDETTKIISMEKIDAMKVKIGYPDYILDPSELDKDYQGLHMQNDSYFKNFLRQSKINHLNEIKKVFSPIVINSKSKWEIYPHTVNAFYNPNKNEIVFPAGILRKPFYDIAYPDAYLFGAIGHVMSHEISHAFDNEGRKYDKNGNWNLWWTNKSIESFITKTNCYIDQYFKYSINGLRVNGIQTLGENMADNGGVFMALQALKNYQIRNKGLKYPSNSNITEDQLFYLAFAQLLCSKETPEAIYEVIMFDNHSPNKYRVNGVVSNLKQFSDAYNCSSIDTMNPPNKCTLWKLNELEKNTK
ncbi:unnamed protein product [Gordionus sp. m RMFG-2023]